MKTISNKLFVAVLGVLLCGGLVALKNPAGSKQFDYVSIVQRGDELHVSGNQLAFEKIKFKDLDKAGQADCSYGELFRKVNEFEAQGYELVENNVYTLGEGNVSRNYVLLRKPRP